MSDILSEIIAGKREAIKQHRRFSDLEEMRNRCAKLPPVRSLSRGLTFENSVSIIAEIKRRSPSRGALNPDLDPAALAGSYEAAGAAAISVLTDTEYFGGSISDLQAARKAVTLPVLRKDFIIDEFQVYESRLIGADAVLLIVSALSPEQLSSLHQLCRQIGLESLVEVHSESEAEIALGCGVKIIGINNRDLRTFEVSLNTSQMVRQAIGTDCITVSESGIRSRSDIELVREWGFDAVLVGESGVTANNPIEHIKGLRGL